MEKKSPVPCVNCELSRAVIFYGDSFLSRVLPAELLDLGLGFATGNPHFILSSNLETFHVTMINTGLTVCARNITL